MRALAIAVVATLGVALVAPVATADEATPDAAITTDVAPATAAVAPTVKTRAQLEADYARGKGKASDMHGVLPSLYRGKWYVPKAEWRRRCIVRRETHGNYRSVGGGGRFRGAYQMNRALALGATRAMEPEVRKEMGAQGVAILHRLRHKPTQQWNRYWQDRAFWTIWHKGSGKAHWRGAGCGKGS